MNIECAHKSRAIGPHIEICLLCASWRQHLYGETNTGQKRTWWPPSVPAPMPQLEPCEVRTYFVDFEETIAELRAA